MARTDRQMLTRIVKRWGSLSEELKRVVLREAGAEVHAGLLPHVVQSLHFGGG